MKAC